MHRLALFALAAGALALSGARADEAPGHAAPADQTAAATPAAEAPSSLSDAELSLYPGSVFAVPDPRGFTWIATDPGDNERLPRPFQLFPPRVPHALDGFVAITLRSNACLDCHALDAGADAPELPASHRTDLRRAPERVGTAVAGGRWVCTSCHVPTTDAPPLRSGLPPAD